MRWVAWVVVVSGCAKPGGATLTPAPSVSGTTAAGDNTAPSATSPTAPVAAGAAPVDALPALPSASGAVTIGNPARDPKSKLCEVVVDGLTMLRQCTGAAGEKVTAAVVGSKRGNCLVTVGDLEIIRPCEGKPNERKAPSSNAAAPNPKMCQRIERTADGDIVTLRPCSK